MLDIEYSTQGSKNRFQSAASMEHSMEHKLGNIDPLEWLKQ